MVAIVREGRLLVVERLDELKKQIQEVTLTLTNGQVPSLDLSAEILSLRLRTHQWQLLVRGMVEQDLARLGHHPAVHALETRCPSLEEIFVAYMQRQPAATGGTMVEEVPAT
jgi:hypothetical protein